MLLTTDEIFKKLNEIKRKDNPEGAKGKYSGYGMTWTHIRRYLKYAYMEFNIKKFKGLFDESDRLALSRFIRQWERGEISFYKDKDGKRFVVHNRVPISRVEVKHETVQQRMLKKLLER